MTVTLTPELEAFVKAKMSAGQYQSPSEVIMEALTRMEQTDEEYLAWLRREVNIGIDQLRNGQSRPLRPYEEFVAEARRRYEVSGES